MAVRALNERISKRLNITSWDQQRLVYGGRPLDSGLTLADYNISNESTVHLLEQWHGGMQTHHEPEPEVAQRIQNHLVTSSTPSSVRAKVTIKSPRPTEVNEHSLYSKLPREDNVTYYEIQVDRIETWGDERPEESTTISTVTARLRELHKLRERVR